MVIRIVPLAQSASELQLAAAVFIRLSALWTRDEQSAIRTSGGAGAGAGAGKVAIRFEFGLSNEHSHFPDCWI